MTTRQATIKEQFHVLLQHISPPGPDNIGIPKPIKDQMERMFFMGYRVCFLSLMEDMANAAPADAEAHIRDQDMEMIKYFKLVTDELTVSKAIDAAAKAVQGDAGGLKQ